jgi:hypothetical protein
MYRTVGSLAMLLVLASAAVAQTDAGFYDPPAHDLLSCSPAPCVLSPTQASPGPSNATNAPIATDPANPKDILVGANDYNCGPNGDGESLGFFLSSDGGVDWSQMCMPYRQLYENYYVPAAGPILGYDRNGAAYIGGFYFDEQSGSSIALEAFQKSYDGIHWTAPAPAVFEYNYDPGYCWMAVDTDSESPYVNSVYVSCVMADSATHRVNQLLVAHSNDGGLTWHNADVASPQTYPERDENTAMAIGKDGTVYLTWEYCDMQGPCDNGPVHMVFSKSGNGGNTWTNPIMVARATLVYQLPNVPGAHIANTPAIGVDASDGPYSDNLYVVMYNWTGDFMQVQVVRSTDGGISWSVPVPVAPGITHNQFFPWISVSPAGLVGVSWLDRRNDPANISYQAFAGISADGGLSFEPNVQLTNAFSNPNTDDGPFGQYDGAAWDGPNYFLSAWMDESNGVNTQDFVGGIRLK